VNRSLIVAVALLAGCGPATRTAFSYRFSDNVADQFTPVMDRLPPPQAHEHPNNALETPLVVVTTHEEPRAVVCIDVESGAERWRHASTPETRPEILEDLVLVGERGRLVALELRSGSVRWTAELPEQLGYVGAARDGNTIYFAATVGALGGARREGHVAALDALTGETRWRHEVEGVFGQPVASAGMVLVPWERQNIAVLDETTGVELARLRSTDDVVAWIFQDPTGIYYGHRGIYRLTHGSVSGTREGATRIELPVDGLPRSPDIFDDGFVPKPGTRSARGRIRVYFAPSPASPDSISIAGGTYYFVYYRYVFAYDLDGSLRWARILEQDVIGAQALEGGLLTVGEQGAMRLLDRTSGSDGWTGGTPMQLASVSLDVAGFAPTVAGGTPRPMREMLSEIVLDPDNRLVDARAYAVRMLATIPDAEITRDLLDLYGQRHMPGTVREAIAAALRGRTTGAEHLVGALGRRYDFIEDTAVPPLEVIVPSLMEARVTSAVPGLVQQMNDHETPAAILPLVVQAVVELGDASVVPALERFLVLYHSDSSFQEHPEALVWAATGIFRLGGTAGREGLTALAGDARTMTGLREGITGLFETERRTEDDRVAREAADAAAAAAEAARRAEAELPERLSQEQINQTFAEHAEPLRECVAGEIARNPVLGQVRLVFILNGDGRPDEIGVAPNTPELVTCMQERVAAIAFPRFRARRMRATFVISVRGGAPVTPSAPTAVLERAIPADAPWWTFWERRANATSAAARDASIRPFWETREPPATVASSVAGGGTTAGGAVGGGTAGTGTAGTGTAGTGTAGTGTAGTGGTGSTGAGTAGASGGDTGAGGGTPWWLGSGGSEEEEVEEEAPAPPPPPPPVEEPRGRGRRGRRGAAPPAASPVAPAAPPPAAPPPAAPPPAAPPPAAPPPAAPPPAAPPPAAPPPAPPEPPAEEENPWWAPAEGG